LDRDENASGRLQVTTEHNKKDKFKKLKKGRKFIRFQLTGKAEW